jgi:thiamine biosynthesis lipoprotein
MTLMRFSTAAAFLLAAATSVIARKPALVRYEFSQAHMGTLFRIVLYAPDAATASTASNAAFDRIATLDDTMSDYRPDSELRRLCRAAGGPPVKVSEDLYRVLATSQDLARRTDGAFDVTIGPVVQLWRRARRRHQLPDARRLARARTLVGFENLRLDPEEKTAQLSKKGMLLDLGGIGKGYAADRALEVLKRHGIRSALVAASGDIAVSAPPPGRKGWRVGIAPLEAPEKPPSRYLSLHDAAVSTSGDVEQHVDIGGKRYSHIVDPRTGMGLTGRHSVTVVAPNATTSDSLATAISVLGPEQGLKLAESTPGVAVLFVEGTEGGTRVWESGLSRYSSVAQPEEHRSHPSRPTN